MTKRFLHGDRQFQKIYGGFGRSMNLTNCYGYIDLLKTHHRFSGNAYSHGGISLSLGVKLACTQWSKLFWLIIFQVKMQKIGSFIDVLGNRYPASTVQPKPKPWFLTTVCYGWDSITFEILNICTKFLVSGI